MDPIQQKEIIRKATKLAFTTPVWKLHREYQKYKDAASVKENLYGDDDASAFGIIFLIALVIGAAIWIWALVVLIKYAKDIPTWALVVGIIFMVLPPGPLVTLIVVYVSKSAKKEKFW